MIINTQVKMVEYLGQGEAVVELNTGERVTIFYDPSEHTSVNDVTVDDITGTLGEWLSMNTSEIPVEAVKLLQEAYNICADEFELPPDYDDDSSRSCKDCPDDECTGHCMSCYYRTV